MNTITFPKLNIGVKIDPVLLHYPNGGGIHWYGVIIAVGVLLALLLCSTVYKKRGRESEELLDFVLWALPIGIVGARLYYVMFSLDSYRGRPLDVFKIWEGGLAVYGGVIAGLITALVFCRVRGINFFAFADVAVLGLTVGQCIGRWGNFVNCEAHGGQTELLWGMSINGGAPVHPTFLYESLWSLAGLAVLIVLTKKRLPSGSCFFVYLAWYGIGRFMIEGLRTDSLYIWGSLRVSQMVAALSVAAGAVGLMRLIGENVKKS